MHNIKDIRNNLELFEKKLSVRNNKIDLKNLLSIDKNNRDLIQKFNGELSKYSALVNKGVQQYQLNLQNSTAEYGWWEKQQLKLQADYDKGIQAMKGS